MLVDDDLCTLFILILFSSVLFFFFSFRSSGKSLPNKNKLLVLLTASSILEYQLNLSTDVWFGFVGVLLCVVLSIEIHGFRNMETCEVVHK